MSEQSPCDECPYTKKVSEGYMMNHPPMTFDIFTGEELLEVTGTMSPTRNEQNLRVACAQAQKCIGEVIIKGEYTIFSKS